MSWSITMNISFFNPFAMVFIKTAIMKNMNLMNGAIQTVMNNEAGQMRWMLRLGLDIPL